MDSSVRSQRGIIRSYELVALLGDWHSDHRTLYEALAERILELVERGDLVPGSILPAERSLAAGLNVSRGTVMNAFMLLRDRSVIESRQGSGTRIRMDVARPLLPDVDLMGVAAASRSLSGRLFDPDPAVIDLAIAMPHDADAIEHITPPSDWPQIEAATNGHGYAPQGLYELRDAISCYFHDRGLRTDRDQVLVTSGAQQALDLCADLAVKPGDTVLVESPTYPGAIDIFARHGARVISFPFRSHGERPGQLREIVKAQAPRLIYLMPQIHNPTGLTLSEDRRREVARLADEFPLYVIDDNTLADLAFEPRPNHLMSVYAKHDRVLTIGSLSKSAWGGLRVGWVRAERALVARMARAKAAKDLSTSAFSQLFAQQVLADYDQVLELRRHQLQRRATVLGDQLERLLPEWRLSPLEGGLSLWVELPYGSADEFAQAALRKGVAVIPGSAHCLDGSGPAQLRLAFPQPEQILRAGARRLHTAWIEYSNRVNATQDTATPAAAVPIRAHRENRAV